MQDSINRLTQAARDAADQHKTWEEDAVAAFRLDDVRELLEHVAWQRAELERVRGIANCLYGHLTALGGVGCADCDADQS